ncbi:repeat-containing protein [Musa troglodytarum]|uniref:Repeat-containing protein n=1 Tax=Musa troglodytarum TaxID=320322 RepID=A0A9E7H0H6_9LILI|nr:repeat-containing protein [Musa troglodytarum]
MLEGKRSALSIISLEAQKSLFSSSSSAASASAVLDHFLPATESAAQETPFSPAPLHPGSFVSALVRCRSPAEIKKVHALATTAAMIDNLGVANKHVYMYAQRGALADAYALFSRMKERDNMSWSVIVGGFVKVGYYANCLQTFRDFVRSGLRIDNFTLPFVLRACRDTVSLRLGVEIHHLVFKAGLQSDFFVSAALVDMYARCGDVDDARKVFDRMPKRDMVTWTVMMSGYADCGNPEESLALFDRMREEGVVPDKIATVTVAFACAKLGVMHKAKMIHDYISSFNFSLNVILGTALIDMYAKCGSADDARVIFDRMRDRNVITWGSMISAYGIHGRGREALDLFPLMLQSGIRPNRITFVSILSACSHAGLVDEGRQFFHSMERDYSIEPDVKHYTCMVDLLGSRWEDVAEVRDLMASRSVRKTPGWTWIEINNETHRFRVGDKSHPQSKEIYETLKVLIEKLESAGYVPDTNFVLHDIDEELKAGFLYTHSEKLAIAFGLFATPESTTLRITKNLRVCGDCHTFIKLASIVMRREIIVTPTSSQTDLILPENTTSVSGSRRFNAIAGVRVCNVTVAEFSEQSISTALCWLSQSLAHPSFHSSSKAISKWDSLTA